jgi:tetratricopeptide (TPR) repeat protein
MFGFKLFKKVTGQYKAAIEDYSRALELNPTHAWLLFRRGLALYEIGSYGEALVDFEKAVAANPAISTDARRYIERCRSRTA